jgi:hypothetical protein
VPLDTEAFDGGVFDAAVFDAAVFDAGVKGRDAATSRDRFVGRGMMRGRGPFELSCRETRHWMSKNTAAITPRTEMMITTNSPRERRRRLTGATTQWQEMFLK